MYGTISAVPTGSSVSGAAESEEYFTGKAFRESGVVAQRLLPEHGVSSTVCPVSLFATRNRLS